ncbi:hypothetical protein PSHT_14810 [Puccinia striiformis]|uniref:Uncharacterized protein n=1 Tax=Puccinia striiformis TaxID=27350 RepID=A0A2S4UI62_9BASI|nr:hypothetical protein PSHT_14810 [Puccinia striiformis]
MQIDKVAEDQQDSTNKSAPKVSTHGPRMSGREVWKASKRGQSFSSSFDSTSSSHSEQSKMNSKEYPQ